MEVGGALRAGGDEEAGVGSGPRRACRTGKQAQMRLTLISTVLQVAVSTFVYVRSLLRAISTGFLEAQDAGHVDEDEDDGVLLGGVAAWASLGSALGV